MYAFIKLYEFSWSSNIYANPSHIGISTRISLYIIIKQEAHGPRLAHLSDITTADMQVTSILSI